jgi:Transposase DDE domain
MSIKPVDCRHLEPRHQRAQRHAEWGAQEARRLATHNLSLEDVRDRVRALTHTEAFRKSSRERKKVEMRFAHMKRIFKLHRLRLRDLSGAKDEVLLTATVQNLAACQATIPSSASTRCLLGLRAAEAAIPSALQGADARAQITMADRAAKPEKSSSFATQSAALRT